MTQLEALLAQGALLVGSSTELTLVAKVTVLLVAGLVSARLCRATRASVRHALLACTFAGVLVLPLAMASMPVWTIGVPSAARAGLEPDSGRRPIVTAAPPAGIAGAAGFTTAPGLTRTPGADIVTIARIVWATGAAALLGMLAAGLLSMRRMRRRGIPALALQARAGALAAGCGIHRRISVITDEDVIAPLTCGLTHPLIALPRDAGMWPADALERALVHELEHARRFDWPIQVLARAACALFWFHPLAWTAWRQLRLEAERACDDAVVRTGDSADYAEQLVALARRMAAAAPRTSLAMAARSDLSARVAALLDPRRVRGQAGATPVCAAAVGALVLVLLMAPVQAMPVAADDSRPVPNGRSGDEWQSREGSRGRSLYHASRRGDVKRMTELIDGGADVNAAIDGDGSPLIGAARAGHLEAVSLLLARGADPNMAVEGDGNPLIMAAREGHVDIVALLLDRGALINQVVRSDETALIQASGSGHVEVVKLLLARGADVNLRVWAELSGTQFAGEWRTALGMARRGRHEAIVRLLIAAGAAR